MMTTAAAAAAIDKEETTMQIQQYTTAKKYNNMQQQYWAARSCQNNICIGDKTSWYHLLLSQFLFEYCFMIIVAVVNK